MSEVGKVRTIRQTIEAPGGIEHGVRQPALLRAVATVGAAAAGEVRHQARAAERVAQRAVHEVFGFDAEAARFATFDAATRLLRRAAARPLLLILEADGSAQLREMATPPRQ